MAKYKDYSYEQTVLLPVNFSNQILPGTFEYTLNSVIDGLDLSIFEERFTNDETGAPAYDPSILLKITLFAYSKGIISRSASREKCSRKRRWSEQEAIQFGRAIIRIALVF